MKPSVGRIVHYVSYGTPGGRYKSTCRAAVITEVNEDSFPGVVNLCVLNPKGTFYDFNVPYEPSDEGTGGTWHWPEKVDG